MVNRKVLSKKTSAVKNSKPSKSKVEHLSEKTSLRSALLLNGGATKESKLLIESPNDNDILFGRGGESNNAKGNRRYQKVIEESSEEYSSLTSRKAKTEFAWNIYSQLRNEGARFLRREKGSSYWSTAPEEACRKKISQRLRERALEARDKKKADNPANLLPKQDPSLDFDDVSIVDPFPDSSDGSIESLVDFVDDFPVSWTLPDPVGSQPRGAMVSRPNSRSSDTDQTVSSDPRKHLFGKYDF